MFGMRPYALIYHIKLVPGCAHALISQALILISATENHVFLFAACNLVLFSHGLVLHVMKHKVPKELERSSESIDTMCTRSPTIAHYAHCRRLERVSQWSVNEGSTFAHMLRDSVDASLAIKARRRELGDVLQT
ncbi:hypothetical protein V8B97DRAFT_21176 [Scleroderma yunnanense]